MKALQYRRSIPRYAIMRMLGPRFPGLYTGGWSPVSLRDIDPPPLPNPHWVRIRPRLAGICGSDVATLCASGSPYLAPLTSMPFVLGHELVGIVQEVGRAVEDVRAGERVVIQPALGCRVRGIEPPCRACAEGLDALCSNVTRGDISAGIQTGYCRDTGGGWSESLVAHHSQVYRVPKEIPDQAAVLIEPFACAVHAALRVTHRRDHPILVLGCGCMGLLTIAALRALDCPARIIAAARHPHQSEHAKRLGADETLDAGGETLERYRRWAKALDAQVLEPELGKPAVIGGAAVTFDCVASSQSIDDSLRFTRGDGTVVLVGMPAVPRNVDWTPMWFKELTVRASYAYGRERHRQNEPTTFEIAIELMRTWGEKLTPLLSAPYPLSEFRAAFASAIHTSRSKAVKTVFAID